MASIEAVSEDLSGRDLGPYHLQRALGSGAGGQVYLAQHRGLERSAALKVVDLRALDEAARARFRRELKAAARVEHPGVARAFASGEQDSLAWLALEHVEGETLAARLERGTLDEEQTVRLGAALAHALAAVHRAGLVHRDLKPANVVLRGDGAPVLVDFGLAQLPERSAPLTRAGALLGTPLYAAPEQVGIDAGGVDARADVFALACLLHAALTGHVPHDTGDRDLRAFLARRRAGEPALSPALPPGLAAILGPALARDPTDRPDAARLAGELEEYVRACHADTVAVAAQAAPPAAAPSTPPASRPEPTARRDLLLAAAAGGLTLLVVLWQGWGARGPSAPSLEPAPPLEPASPTGPASTGPAPTGPAPTGPAPTGPAPTGPAPTPDPLHAVLAALEQVELDRAARLLAAAPHTPELDAARRLLRVLEQLNGDEPLEPVGGFERVASQAPRVYALIERLEPELSVHAYARGALEKGNLAAVTLALQRRIRQGDAAPPRHLRPARAPEFELLERLAHLQRRSLLFPGQAADELARLRASPLGRTTLARRTDATLAAHQERWETRAGR